MMNRLFVATPRPFLASYLAFHQRFILKKLAFKNACRELKSTSVLSSEYQDEVTMMIKARSVPSMLERLLKFEFSQPDFTCLQWVCQWCS
jgi:hypothetical protein